jgi:hypothetical protein
MSLEILRRYFEALRGQDWESLALCLVDDVHRNGPYLDVVQGKHAYVEFLAGIVPTLKNYDLQVHRIRVIGEASALVELSEILDVSGVRTEFPEVLLFDFDDNGLISRVDIYIKQTPAKRAGDVEHSDDSKILDSEFEPDA